MKRVETKRELTSSPFPESFLRFLDAHRIPLKDVLTFDIETTGLSPKSALIYLIGVARVKGNTLYTTQYLAQTEAEERDVLLAFAKELAACKLLLHFNGDQFDLPFVAARSARYNIGTDLVISSDDEKADVLSFDLLKKVRPLKTALGLPDCRLKSIERLLKIDRQDAMSGGELIGVFRDYALHPTAEAEALLLLHNADDIAGTFSLLPVLAFDAFYENLDERMFSHADLRTETYTTFTGGNAREAYLTLQCKEALPASFACQKNGIRLRHENGTFLLRIPVFSGELKHFFPDHKNYFYLPYEDMAVHKSVGEFVDKNFRRKATREEAFVKKEGDFLPSPSDTGLPRFQGAFKDNLFYIENSEDLTSSESDLILYGISLLRYLAGFS